MERWPRYLCRIAVERGWRVQNPAAARPADHRHSVGGPYHRAYRAGRGVDVAPGAAKRVHDRILNPGPTDPGRTHIPRYENLCGELSSFKEMLPRNWESINVHADRRNGQSRRRFADRGFLHFDLWHLPNVVGSI